MDKLKDLLAPRAKREEETLLVQAIRRELQRRNLTKAVGGSHHPVGALPVPEDAPKPVVH